MGTISATTHEFCRDKDASNNGCLYESFRFLHGNLKSINKKYLRCLVADYIILNHENIHPLVSKTDAKYKNVKDYHNQIKKGKLNGDKAEIQALARRSKLVIHIVSIKTNTSGNFDINILNYGEDNEASRECIYILYDEENQHYSPLYIINKENSCEKTTIFPPNDEIVKELLEKFIRQEFGGCHNEAYETDLPTQTNLINETEQLCNLISSNTRTIVSNKRKLPGGAIGSYTNSDEVKLSLSTSNSDVVDKPKKLAKGNMDDTSTIEQHLQTDFSNNEYGNLPTVSNEDRQEPRMKLEIEPALKFRGRTGGDFKPKKKQNRKGKPSKTGPPRYFADRNNKRIFYLLIPEKCLSPNIEYRVEIYLITRDINGYSYVQPYFKIQVDPTDEQTPNENPIHFTFYMADLEEYLEGIKRLPLRLVIVQQTNPQLMKVQQPLKIFSSSNTELAIRKTYTSHRTFKKAYHLHDLRFALTLYKRAPGETEFRQCDDMQYISQTSTEDKKHKILKK